MDIFVVGLVVEIGFGAHTLYCQMGTAGGKDGQIVKMNTHLLLVPRLTFRNPASYI
jgi:hypothetical protein